MAKSMLLTAVFLALTCILSVDALYSKSSPVLQLTAKTYDSLIAQSNHTSIVEFYAPWCGHCKSLQPVYEKVAKKLAGLAKVAAIDCDAEANKAWCGSMGVQGFPTLKIVKPGSKPGRPIVEDYQGPRDAKSLADAVTDKIRNHVEKLQGETLDKWLEAGSSPAKAIVFTDKATTSPLIKSLAIDFLGTIDFAQVRHKDTAQKYGVSKFPSVQLIASPGATPIPYEGEINRESLVSFFSQVAPPNPDPAPQSPKSAKSSGKKPKSKPSSSASAAFSSASEAHKSSDFEDHLAGSSTIVLDDTPPTESPLPIVEHEQKPMIVPDIVDPLPTLATPAELEASCLSLKSGNCILVLHSDDQETSAEQATSALASLAQITGKYKKRKASVIPMYAVPAQNQAAGKIRQDLDLDSEEITIIATNMKRGWWRRYQGNSYNVLDLETFIDAIKHGEGVKSKLPPGFGVITEFTQSTETLEVDEDVAEPEPVESTAPLTDSGFAEPEAEETSIADHDEL